MAGSSILQKLFPGQDFVVPVELVFNKYMNIS